MLEHIKQIAQHLRQLRNNEGISAQEMATHCNISLARYNSYENCEIEVPLSVLYNAGEKLGVELTEFLVSNML